MSEVPYPPDPEIQYRYGFNPQSRSKGVAWEPTDDDLLWLLTKFEYDQLPEGTQLMSVSNRHVIVGENNDFDTRAGYLAYGLLESQIFVVD